MDFMDQKLLAVDDLLGLSENGLLLPLVMAIEYRPRWGRTRCRCPMMSAMGLSQIVHCELRIPLRIFTSHHFHRFSP